MWIGGVLDDAGGDDVYDLQASTSTDYASACACATATSRGLGGIADAIGQGAISGYLHDRGGNDAYRATATVFVRNTARNNDTTGDARAHADGGSRTGAQGWGGSLVDDAGNDVYANRAITDLAAAAHAETGAIATVKGATTLAEGQGYLGELTDRAGLDSYSLTARPSTSVTPDVPGRTDGGYADARGQGLLGDLGNVPETHAAGGEGGLLDVDAGELDVFQSDQRAQFSLCSTEYGTAPGWIPSVPRTVIATGNALCSDLPHGAVVTSAAPVAQAPALELSMASADNGEPGAHAVTVRVRDAGGLPLGGVYVRVLPEVEVDEPYIGIGPMRRWSSAGQGIDLVTDADGVATGSLPKFDCYAQSPCPYRYRYRAAFFGVPGTAGPATVTSAVVEPAMSG
jgi:hypothetical protein